MTFPIIRHLIEGDDAAMMSFTAPGGTARTLSDKLGASIYVKDFGAKGDGVTDDSAAIATAYAKGLLASSAHLIFDPGGLYLFDNTALQINAQHMTFIGYGATILFKHAGVWVLGDTGDVESLVEFKGLRFTVDPSSSVDAPLSLYNTGRTTFIDCAWSNVLNSGIDLRCGVVILRGCNPAMAAGTGAFVNAAIPTGLSGAIFIQDGRYDGRQAQAVVAHSGLGQLDGMFFAGASISNFGHALVSTPSGGGYIGNMMAFGCLFDQLDQAAFIFAPGAGSPLKDVTIKGNKFNSWGSSTATSGALLTVDLTAVGATHTAPLVVTENVFANARSRGLEILGGAFGSVIVSRNTFTDYGSRSDVSSRAAYVNGTFDYLEIADNHGRTSYTHDYDIERAWTATQSKITSNTWAGTHLANIANIGP